MRDVGAVVGLGDHHADHQLAAGDARQPPSLLLVGATLHDCPSEDLGPGDERPADAERSPRQLLGGDDHAEVVVLAAGREAAVLLGHRQAEPADLGQAADDVLGDVGVRAVDVLCDRPHLLGREPVERLADELEVVGQVRGTGPVLREAAGDRLEELGRAALGDEVERGLERVGRHAPDLLASDDPARDVGDHVGDECARQHPFELAVRAVVEHDAAPLEGAGGVREVVGQDLVPIQLGDGHAPVLGRAPSQVLGGSRGELGGGVDRRRGRFQPNCHAGRLPTGTTDGPTRPAPARYRRELPVVDLVVAVGAPRRDPGTDELPGASMVALTAPATACCVIRHAGSRRSNTVSASRSPPSGVRWIPSAPRTRATLPPGTGSIDAYRHREGSAAT